MKCWQAAWFAKLNACLAASGQPLWTAQRAWKLVVTQATLQPIALFARPVAMLITIPYLQTRAYFENVMIIGDGTENGVREVSGKSVRLARLWWKRNAFLYLLLFLLGFIIWCNVAFILFWAPELLRMFTGVETAFTRSPYTFFNTTFLAVSIGFTYLFVNPLTKASYVLRCFYGESLHSGDDLMLGMRKAVKAAAAAASAAVLRARRAGGFPCACIRARPGFRR